MTLLWLATAWLAGAGAAAAGFADLSPGVIPIGAGAALGLVGSGRGHLALLVAACALVAGLAALRYENARPPLRPGGIASFNDVDPISVRGTVVQEPEPRGASQRLRLRAESYDDGSGWRPTAGGVLVTTRPFPSFQYGDRLEVTGRLEAPPTFETFDYREYLARQGVVSLAAFPEIRRVGTGGGSPVARALADVRRWLGDGLDRALTEPEAALAKGILLGQRSALPRDLTDDFNRSGISHLVAISGYNVTLVAGLAVGSLGWLLGRRPATVAAMALVVVFALLVGAGPSVLRAAIMGIVMLGASLAGRPGSGLTAVALAAAALTVWRPLAIDDVSFQLSFAATLGLLLLARPIADRLGATLVRVLPAGLATPLAENLAVTTAASLAVLPIIAANFGRVSVVAIPANLVAVPAFPLILVSSAVAAVAGSLWPPLAGYVGQAAYLPLAYLVDVGRFASSVPAAALSLPRIGLWAAALMYVAVAALVLVLRLRGRPELAEHARLRLGPAVPATCLVVGLSVMVWAGVFSGDSGRLRVTVLDIGQGDAILIETPAGHNILIDGGPSEAAIMQALGRALSPRVRRIDLVVLSHAQDDHVTGLVSVLERYSVGSVLAPPLPGGSAAYAAWQAEVESGAVTSREAVASTWIDLGRGVRLEVLAPPDPPLRGTPDDLNSNSIVLRLVYGDLSFLLTGDLSAEGEEALLRTGVDLRSAVLKLGHHGSDGSSTAAFLAAVRPSVAVASAGAGNNFGHPSPSTILRLGATPLLRTDRNGSVRFETDGKRLWADIERASGSAAERRPAR